MPVNWMNWIRHSAQTNPMEQFAKTSDDYTPHHLVKGVEV